MGAEESIDRLYAKAGGTLRIQLEQANQDEWVVHLTGRRSAFEFLAEGIADVVAGIDCHFDLSPFGAGCGWFGCFSEEEPNSERIDGRVLAVNEGGLYVHCQPCQSSVETFSGRRGIAWMCFSDELSESGTQGLDYNPAFLMIEGFAEELLQFKHLFLQAANGTPEVFAQPTTLKGMFSETVNVGISLKLTLTA